MKPTAIFPILAILFAVCGCANPAQTYATHHPELAADHRQILKTGRIPDGTAVAGMTREQVRLAMGLDPIQFTKVDGLDAWVFVKEQGRYAGPADARDPGYDSAGSSNSWFNREPTGAPTESAESKRNMRTTVIFQGNRAVRAEVAPEKAGE